MCALLHREIIFFACAMFVGRRNVYTGLVPMGLLSLGGILGRGKSQPIPGVPAIKVAHSMHAARILPH